MIYADMTHNSSGQSPHELTYAVMSAQLRLAMQTCWSTYYHTDIYHHCMRQMRLSRDECCCSVWSRFCSCWIPSSWPCTMLHAI